MIWSISAQCRHLSLSPLKDFMLITVSLALNILLASEGVHKTLQSNLSLCALMCCILRDFGAAKYVLNCVYWNLSFHTWIYSIGLFSLYVQGIWNCILLMISLISEMLKTMYFLYLFQTSKTGMSQFNQLILLSMFSSFSKKLYWCFLLQKLSRNVQFTQHIVTVLPLHFIVLVANKSFRAWSTKGDIRSGERKM